MWCSHPDTANWKFRQHGDAAVAADFFRYARMMMENCLTARDINLSWLALRIMPLQQQSHLMCFLFGRRDPTRVSRRDLSTENLNAWLSLM